MCNNLSSELDDAPVKRLERFLRRDCPDLVFSSPVDSPTRPTGFCHCDRSFLHTIAVYARGLALNLCMVLPSSRLKASALRLAGARVGRDVHIAYGVWIDPVFPQLLTIEDGVFLGMWTRIFTHEFRPREFRAGRVILRREAFVGGCATIGCGTVIGEGACVAAGAVVEGEFPNGCVVIGNPPRIVRPHAARSAHNAGVSEGEDGK